MSISFSPESPIGKQLAAWWLKLKEDTASRAELRQCNSVEEVIMTPAYQRLCIQLQGQFKETKYWQERIAIIAGLASHLKYEHASQVLEASSQQVEKIAEQLAEDEGGGRPKVSELRFRRLIQRNGNELYTPMLRILRMLKGKANLYGLAESVFYWGDNIKKRWAFSYFPKIESRK